MKREPQPVLYRVALASDDAPPVLSTGLFLEEGFFAGAMEEQKRLVPQTLIYRTDAAVLWLLKTLKNLLRRQCRLSP